MSHVVIETPSNNFHIVNTTDVTTSSVTEPVPTVVKPSGTGVIEMGFNGGVAPNGVMLVPYGVGSATNTFTLKVYGWRPTLGAQGTVLKDPLWVPFLLASFTCTLCTKTGVTSSDIDATHLFCDTIVLVTGNANVSNEIISPTGNVIANIIMDVKGVKLLELRYATGGSATSANCLAAEM